MAGKGQTAVMARKPKDGLELYIMLVFCVLAGPNYQKSSNMEILPAGSNPCVSEECGLRGNFPKFL